MLRWLNLQAGFNPFFRQQHVINQPLRGLSLRYGFARYYPGRIADPVSPYPGAALVWLEATPFEISNQFQPLDGGMTESPAAWRQSPAPRRPGNA